VGDVDNGDDDDEEKGRKTGKKEKKLNKFSIISSQKPS
jgi:hypothetical protein